MVSQHQPYCHAETLPRRTALHLLLLTAISQDDFRTIVFSAAAMEHKNARIVHRMQHALDHPVSIYHPEGEYLKGLMVEGS